MLEQQKSAVQAAVTAAFQVHKQERVDFVNRLKAVIW